MYSGRLSSMEVGYIVWDNKESEITTPWVTKDVDNALEAAFQYNHAIREFDENGEYKEMPCRYVVKAITLKEVDEDGKEIG